MAKSPIVLPLSTTFLQRFSQHFSTDGGRNLIGRRTRTDRTADGIRSDGERNPIGRKPIGRRTESDRTANANGGRLRGCTCLKCTNRARNAPTEQDFADVEAVTNCSLPSMSNLMLNFISFALFSAYK